jgi:hypothetical protein
VRVLGLVLLGALAALLLGEGLNLGFEIQPGFLLVAFALVAAVAWLASKALRRFTPLTRALLGVCLVGIWFGFFVTARAIVLDRQADRASALAGPSIDAISRFPGSTGRYRTTRIHNDTFGRDFWDVNYWYALSRIDAIPARASLKQLQAHFNAELSRTGCPLFPIADHTGDSDMAAEGAANCDGPVGSADAGMLVDVDVFRRDDHWEVWVTAGPDGPLTPGPGGEPGG